MMPLNAFSELISGIYDAALDPPRWPQTLQRLLATVRANAGALLIAEPKRRRLNVVSVGFDPAALKSYNSYYGRIDPVAAALEQMPVGLVLTSEALVPRSQQLRTEFYNDWAHPNELDYGACAIVRREGSGICALFLGGVRAQAFDDPEALRPLRLLIPHLQHAIQAQLRLGELGVQLDRALAVLDRLRHGVLLATAGGKLLFVNRVAADIAAQADGLTISTAGLRAALSSEDATLQRLIWQASVGTDDQPRIGGRLAVSRPSARRPFAVLVVPLRLTPAGLADSPAAAIVLIVDPEREPQVSPTHLQQLYSLTPAEATVAVRILRGHGLQSVADELSVTLSTVRIHLQRVFEKTQTHRQAELVRLLLDIQADIRSDASNQCGRAR